jgi:hypothetical protein
MTLIQRYVCMGDDLMTLAADQQGRFADITKSADLYLNTKPDPTLSAVTRREYLHDARTDYNEAKRRSRICVVVLSAHQALSAMDMGLIRLISNVKAREVLISSTVLMNCPTCRASAGNPRQHYADLCRQQSLKTHRSYICSAYWANIALKMTLMKHADSAEALITGRKPHLKAENR